MSYFFRNVKTVLLASLVAGLWIMPQQAVYAQSDQIESGLECSECHSDSGWTPLSSSRTFSHATTAFPLEGRHASVQCRDCHTGSTYEEIHDFQEAETECSSCHIDVHDGQLGLDCGSCHESTNWTSARTTFDHNETRFPLVGVHKSVDCQSCHDLSDPISIANVPLDCFGCHDGDYNSALEPNHAESGFPTDCEMCHDVNATAWTQSDFDHDLTAFPLEGTHDQVLCADCHSGADFSAPGLDCMSCHTTDYNEALVDHDLAEFGTNCTECHSVTQWNNVIWSHQTQAEYPLEGEHISVTCLDCHVNNEYDVEKTCETCHDPKEYTNIVDHDAAFETYDDCEECHPGPEAWSPSTWDHNVETDFTLTGAHVSETCFSCHTDNAFDIQSTCYSCHQVDYESTAGEDFDHVAQGIPTTCETCHNTSDWGEAEFDHDQTNFPLTGAHATDVSCVDCHADGVYTGLATTCESCHQDDFDGTSNPPHTTAGFTATNCEQCHNTSAFAPSEWDHDSATDFVIDGAHVSQTCNNCHDGTWIDYAPTTETTCYTCHQVDYESTAGEDFDHIAQDVPTTCELCHNTSDWEDATFDHDQTDFPLTGSHTEIECLDCHDSGVYDGLATTCESCHQDDFDGTSNPPHTTAGFTATNCEQCHNTSAFAPSEWDHDSATDFVIDGAHVGKNCNTCHDGTWIDYAPTTETTCYTCHESDYQSTAGSNFDHVAQAYPTTCTTCHNTSDWGEATFDHDQTDFPLTGSHTEIECLDCHDSGVYDGLATTCESCHTSDFNDATNPNHSDAGFALADCETCHNTTAFAPSLWDHATETNFTIDGAHVSQTCNTCHDGTWIDYAPTTETTCYTCHQQDYDNEPIHANQGFGTSCLDCHTTSTFGDAEIDHAQYFPIYSGEHAGTWEACATCHIDQSDRTVFTCITGGCHDNESELNQEHQEEGVAGYSYESNACYSCHPSGDSDDVFDHSQTGFLLDGQHVTLQCDACHINNDYETQLNSACVACHEDNYNESTNPVHADAGFDTECESCHNTAGFLPSGWSHEDNTGFGLLGTHANQRCNDCHATGEWTGYDGTNITCSTCHLDDYNSANNPNHIQAGFGETCEDCHNSTGFLSSTWSHDSNTDFTLEGDHATVTCNDCHATGEWTGYDGTNITCSTCHLNDYNTTTDPDHADAGFPESCNDCHNSFTQWTGATFDHGFYPLQENHSSMECIECHSEPNYQPQCMSCHTADFFEEHDSGEPQDCWSCHSTSDWDDDDGGDDDDDDDDDRRFPPRKKPDLKEI